MDAQQILAAVKKYREILEKHNIGVSEHPTYIPCVSKKASLEHSHWMLDQIEKFLAKETDKEQNLGKAMRWLCFVQHDVWSAGYLTIDELKDDNRPEEKTA